MKPMTVWQGLVVRLWRRAWERRRLLIALHGVVAALAVGVALILPRWYTASVTLVPAPTEGLTLDLTGAGALLSAAPFGLGAGPTPQDQLCMVLRSRAVADTLLDRFALRERWRLKRRDDARQQLGEMTHLTTPREGQVLVDVEAQEPALARDLADAYARAAAAEGIRLKSSLASQRRVYLERRMADLERELSAASTALRQFEESHGAVSLPDQARETVESFAALRARKVLLETELAAARRYFTDESPEVRTLRDRIGELDRQVSQLNRAGGTMQLGGKDLPALRQRYVDLTREQTSLMAVAELLRRAREQSRVEEANPVPTFSILDAAEIPELPSRPSRKLVVLVAVALCACASVGWLWWTDPERARAPTQLPIPGTDAPAELRRAA